MTAYLIKNISIVNQGEKIFTDILLNDGIIAKVGSQINTDIRVTEIDGTGKYLLPGIIDGHVHFREPGLTRKGDIHSESIAAVAGGVTSFMDMPNTNPPVVTRQLLEEKYLLAANNSLANYSFYMGSSKDNLEEVLSVDPSKVCGVKVFFGSSTGDMQIENEQILEHIFSKSGLLVSVHCEDDAVIKNNIELYKKQYGENIPMECHAEIRNETACYNSTARAIALAKANNTRLHIMHVSTEEELNLLESKKELDKKMITAEVCPHHLWFDKNDYQKLGAKIKCNPSIKVSRHKDALLTGLNNGQIDVVGSDHAPHHYDEKKGSYFEAPSGIPTIQHTLNIMLELYHQSKISLETIVEKMCHNPAICYGIEKRGFVLEGFAADLVIVDLDVSWKVNQSNIKYKCGWSPFEGQVFSSKVTHTFVNGNLVYDSGKFNESEKGSRLTFT